MKLLKQNWLKLVLIILIFGAFYVGRNSAIMKTPSGTNIIFPQKNFYDSAKTISDGFIEISGTLTGNGIGYKNNLIDINCYKDEMKCYTNIIDQIGPNQIGRPEGLSILTITNWQPEFITAILDDVGCWKTTLNIARETGSAEWVQESINQAQLQCKDSENKIYKWTIDNPPMPQK